MNLLSSWDDDFPIFANAEEPTREQRDAISFDMWRAAMDYALTGLATGRDLGKDFWRSVVMGLALRNPG
jgi:hypothetical protein